jgi:flagellar protein FlbD
MIGVTRTSGERCLLDPSDIQRVEAHATTVVYLTDGAKYCVEESIDEIIGRVRAFRAGVLTSAWRIVDGTATGQPAASLTALAAGAGSVVRVRTRLHH